MKKPELIIMYTWDINGYYDNKVCGHMYEIIDYYFILKDHFDTKIIFPKEYNLDEVLSKYNITIEEKIELSDSIIPRPKSGIVKTRGGNGLVLITDGNLGNFKGIIHVENILSYTTRVFCLSLTGRKVKQRSSPFSLRPFRAKQTDRTLFM